MSLYLEFRVTCRECGQEHDICSEHFEKNKVASGESVVYLEVAPCETCVSEARNEGAEQ